MTPTFHSTLLFLLLLSPLCVLAQTRTIPVGQSLVAGDAKASPWLSPNGDFAFGFRQIEPKGDLFVVAIWFSKTPDNLDNIVWYPKEKDPAPRGSKLELTADRGFVLNDPKSGLDLWELGGGTAAAAAGLLNDNGNLVISGSDSKTLWQSFDVPADTMLRGQVLKKQTGSNFLSSRHSMANFSLGKFQLRLQEDGNFLMNSINLPTKYIYDAYYYTATVGTGSEMVFNESGNLYVSLVNNSRFPLGPVPAPSVPPATEAYLRATLSFDGIFTLYSLPKNSSAKDSWSPIWSIPENICKKLGGGLQGVATGPCGFNSVCRLNNHSVVCGCPPTFSRFDDTDQYAGCKPNYVPSCEPDVMRSPESVYSFASMEDTDWMASDYERLNVNDMEDCKSYCLQDCLCAVAVYQNGVCNKKRLPLSYGGESYGAGMAYVKVLKNRRDSGIDPLHEKGKDRGGLVIVISALLGSSALFNLIFLFLMCMGAFLWYNNRFARLQPRESITEGNLQCFTYKELDEATDCYKEELGRGSFGIVYKGEVCCAGGVKVPVAVKKLFRVEENGEKDSEKEFKAEVNVIGQTYHKNLVRLIGFCNEGQHRLLVYEFLSNGTLASLLYGDMKPTWEQRTQIALGIGRGLLYLHEECKTQVIHCDIKPQNILLDEYYNARIADFGLAKLLMMNQSQTHTAIRGTKGYVAPEWFRNLAITAKVDVYSFGVLLLEIICCRKSVDMEMGGQEKAILSDWAYDCYRKGTLDDLVENHDKEVMNDMTKLERFLMVAIWCIQEDPSLRPNMKKVMLMLEGIVHVATPPNPCPFNSSIST